jgi:hypothetical protein
MTFSVSPQSLENSYVNGRSYYVNDLLNDTTFSATFSNGFSLNLNLKPYGSAVCIISDTVKRLSVPLLVGLENGPGTTRVDEFRLFQNFPNPFNPTTTIRYELPKEGRVRVSVFNLLGEEVATLVDGRRAAGAHEVRWNANNQGGTPFPSGVYFVKVEAGTSVEIKRMMLLK